MDPMRIERDMIEVGRRLWIKDLVAANDGNLSVRLGDGTFLCTATGSIKGFLTPDDLVRIDASAEPVSGDRRPSSEIQMHLAIYAERPDVHAVVHAHPPTATGFATAGVPLDECVLPEIVATLGAIPTVPYGTPSTKELAEAVRKTARTGYASLLANHGAVTYGPDILSAYHHMERVEHFAKILLTARRLGNVQRLSRDDVARLHDAIGGRPAAAACRTRDANGTGDEDEELIESVAAEVRRILEERG